MENKIKYIFISILIISFIIWISYIIRLEKEANRHHLQTGYHGIILEIKTSMGDRGIPNIKVNDEWIDLDISDEKIIHYIQTGDSIIKKSGSDAINVYRKNKNGIWNIKEFK